MKVGMNMLLWTGDPTQLDYQVIAQLAEMGFDGVELLIAAGVPVKKYAEIGRQIRESGIPDVTACAVMPKIINPMSPNRLSRKAAVNLLKRVVDRCNALQCAVLAGPIYETLGKSERGRTDEERQWAAEVIWEAAVFAQGSSVKVIAIEPINRFELDGCNTVGQACELARLVNHPLVKVLVDAFHMHREEKSMSQPIIEAGKLVAHVHVSENDRGIPGTGQIHWDDFFNALKEIRYDGWIVLEMFGHQVPGLAAATKIFRSDIIPDCLKAAEQGLAFVRGSVAIATLQQVLTREPEVEMDHSPQSNISNDCPNCGAVMSRHGSSYKCLNCGTTV